ncbi:HlyD family efflux transporter periplasmic adaptor subunit [Clostridium sp. YIM B02505]|uniref:HlyD family efflux transporter periplasmic adaptor subunit n=1 Tax=Clostridium yunnanense TaxID=2800325 RepID=A0ABS1ETH6_9CLOT|nr:HlyD family efflux transporter periplasmic adaptor subunit [Clostridium yunnanense]MBK1812694.1 HlyD family efflux transporter periplasmic adaptor subunit [Clostridium yunnanense]
MKKIFKNRKNLDYEFMPDVIEIIETPPSPLGSFFIIIVGIIFTIIFLWTYYVKVDKIVEAGGKVIPEGNVKIVQSTAIGKISKINVNEGQKVKQGDIIVNLDSTDNSIQISKLENDLVNDRIELSIIKNDLDGKWLDDGIDLSKASDEIKKYYDDYKNNKKSLSERDIQNGNKQIEKINKQISDEQSKLAELKAKVDSVQNNPDAKLDLIYAQNEYNNQFKKIEGLKDSLKDAKESVDTANKQRKDQTLSEVISKEKQIKELEYQLKVLENQKTNSQILAPVDGYISTLNYNTVGSSIMPDKPIATVVPENTKMIIEAFVQNKDIGKVRVGQQVILKMEPYPYQSFGVVNGEISQISSNSYEDKSLGNVYKINITLKEQSIKSEGKEFKLFPGMNAQVDINVGKRRIIEYFLDPFKKAIDETFSG